MDINDAADQLAELGHVTRLGVYRALVKAGDDGLPVSEIMQQLEIPASTLSHHISRLVRVGLIKQVRQGRVLRCHAQYRELTKLMNFLTKECCVRG
jgi:DNA-binding transcriptional ArsR family regulator